MSGLINVDVAGVVNAGANLTEKLSDLFNADEKAKVKIAELVKSGQDATLQATIAVSQEVTKRLQSDNSSDITSTKTIRPKLATHAAVMCTLLSAAELSFAFLVKPTENQVTIVQSLLWFWGSIYISIIGFYFTPKALEVLNKIKSVLNIKSGIAVKSEAPGYVQECIYCKSKDVLPNQFVCKTCKGE